MTLVNEAAQAQFERDGYVALKGLLDAGAAASIAGAAGPRLVRDVLPGIPREHVFFEDKDRPDSLKQIQQLWQHDRWFGDFMTEGRCRRVAEALLGDDVVPKNMQYFNKAPGVGQPTPPHQDGFYFKLEPCAAVTMWLALDVVDEENGCVRYVPGSHRHGMRPHRRTETLGFSQGIEDYGDADLAAEVPMPAEPGDLLVHHAMTIHRADGNKSATRTRKAIGLIYYGASAREDAAAHDAYQKQLARDMREAGKI